MVVHSMLLLFLQKNGDVFQALLPAPATAPMFPSTATIPIGVPSSTMNIKVIFLLFS